MNAPLSQVEALPLKALSEPPEPVSKMELDWVDGERALLAQVESTMDELVLGRQPDQTGTMAFRQVASGGKRMRARLALQACAQFDVSSAVAVSWAAAIELLHNATLIHDDIQDGDTVRRGEATVWAQYGLAQGINAGDFLLMQPFLALQGMPLEIQGPLSMMVAKYATSTVRGQVDELALKGTPYIDFGSYLRACEGKTGALLALPVVGAAICGGRSIIEAERLAMPFVQLGVLFQLQDDVIDLYGEKGRGEEGCDIREGKVSALLLAHLENSPGTRAEVLSILEKPREETTAADVERVVALYDQSDALRGVLNRIEHMRSQVLDSLPLRHEPGLRKVAKKLVEMALAPIAHLTCEEAK